MPPYKVLLEVVVDDEILSPGGYDQSVAGSEVTVQSGGSEDPAEAAKSYLLPLLECDAIGADGVRVLKVWQAELGWKELQPPVPNLGSR